MRLTDSHAHFDHLPDAETVAATLQRAREAGVARVGAIGATHGLTAALQLPTLLAAHPELFGVAGVHPHDASGWEPEVAERLEALFASTPRLVAIGETGLDYHYDLSPRDRQARAFEDQLRLARRLGKPVVLHVREAHAEARALLAAHEPPAALVHCFTGTIDDARWYLERGFHLSFSGILTFRSADEIREVAARAPLERVLVETDSPYLAPEPRRKVFPNEPALVVHTALCLAGLRGLTLDEVAEATTRNAERFFGLSPMEPSPPV